MSGVLRFIKDNERIVKSTSSHVCQRSDFDTATLLLFSESVRTEHFKKCVIKRSEIWVYLTLQVARKKAQLFSCFHRRTCEDYLLYLVRLESFYRHCHRKISLARSRRTNAHDDSLFPYCFNISFLTESFRLDELSAHRYAHAVIRHMLYLILLALTHKCENISYSLLSDSLALVDKSNKAIYSFRGVKYVLLIACYLDIVTSAENHNIILFLDKINILVIIAEKAEYSFHSVHADKFFRH